MARMTIAERLAAKEAKLANQMTEIKELRKQQERLAAARLREHERALGALVLKFDASITPERLQAILEAGRYTSQ